MRHLALALAATAILALPVLAPAQDRQKEQNTEEAAVRAVLDKQVADWNRGDLAAFETGYKDSPDILFVSSTVRRGYKQMQDSYAHGYGTPEARGTLRFADLEVRALDARFATVLGHFYLQRVEAGGGNADGIFTLVLEKTAAGWKIVLDHTNPGPVPPKHP